MDRNLKAEKGRSFLNTPETKNFEETEPIKILSSWAARNIKEPHLVDTRFFLYKNLLSGLKANKRLIGIVLL